MRNLFTHPTQSLLTAKTSEPDHFDFDSQDRPNLDFVMSRSLTGEIRSRYIDDSWDFRAYATSNISDMVFYFNDSKLEEYHQEHKWLTFLLIYHPGARRFTTSYSTIRPKHVALRRIAKFAKERGRRISECFSNNDLYRELIKKSTDHQKKETKGLLNSFYAIPSSISGFKCLPPDQQEGASFYKSNQTAPIPERILLAAITKLNQLISDYLEHEDKITRFCQKLATDYLYARCIPTQKGNSIPKSLYHPSFPEAAYNYKLTDLFAKNKVNHVANLSRYLSKIQFCCKTLIHIFSGMRNSEGYSLKFHCLTEKNYKGINTLSLLGITTKLESGASRETYWVTSPEVYKAIEAAQSICRIIAFHLGQSAENIPLFSSTSHTNFSNGNFHLQTNGIALATLTHFSFNESIFDDDVFRITNEDIRFLKKIDFARTWEHEEKFQIGNFWPFATHQFRRSLAIYGLSSGLVSLTSLKRQFKHISAAMTLYYVRGALSHLRLFGDAPDHFKNEVLETKSFVEAIDYLALQASSETLGGAHGIFIENKLKPLGETIIYSSRDETMRRVRRGEISYNATPTGGCVLVGVCNKTFHNPLSRCTGCSNRVLIPSKALEAIEKSKELIRSLPPGPERNTEQAELDALLEEISKVKLK